jgi:hypothetical protein
MHTQTHATMERLLLTIVENSELLNLFHVPDATLNTHVMWNGSSV